MPPTANTKYQLRRLPTAQLRTQRCGPPASEFSPRRWASPSRTAIHCRHTDISTNLCYTHAPSISHRICLSLSLYAVTFSATPTPGCTTSCSFQLAGLSVWTLVLSCRVFPTRGGGPSESAEICTTTTSSCCNPRARAGSPRTYQISATPTPGCTTSCPPVRHPATEFQPTQVGFVFQN